MNNIRDLFGRVHDYLRISITENCNLRCTYCMPAEGIKLTPKEHIMTADEIEIISKTFVSLGVKKIRLTGGEPLVRKDAKDIINRLSKLNIDLNITTNGLLVHEYIDTFKSAKINTINISLDTLQGYKYKQITRRNHFEILWKNINLLLEHNFKVKLNVVLIADFNKNEIIDFINLTKELNIQIRFIEFMPFNGNHWDKSKLVTHQEILEVVSQNFNKEAIVRLNDKLNDTAKNYKIDNHKGTFSIISTVTNPFCDSCNRIRLTADGKLKNCLFSNSETSLLDALRQEKSIIPLIKKNIKSKYKIRGGFETDESFVSSSNFDKNRSMITIGG